MPEIQSNYFCMFLTQIYEYKEICLALLLLIERNKLGSTDNTELFFDKFKKWQGSVNLTFCNKLITACIYDLSTFKGNQSS